MSRTQYLRDQAAHAQRLAHDSTHPMLQVSLRRLADEYKMRADELEDDEIRGVDPDRD